MQKVLHHAGSIEVRRDAADWPLRPGEVAIFTSTALALGDVLDVIRNGPDDGPVIGGPLDDAVWKVTIERVGDVQR